MSDIGSVLRTAREEKNITLEMVEKETSIRLKPLKRTIFL